MITEDEFVDYPSESDLYSAIPPSVLVRLRQGSFRSPLDQAFWNVRRVEALDVSLEEYIEGLWKILAADGFGTA